MADIKIIVDSGDVVTAAKKTKTLEGNVKLLSNAFKGNSLSSRNYYKGIKELADATGKSESELREYANQLRATAKATAAAAAAAKAATAARIAQAQADRVAAQAAKIAAQDQAKAARTVADVNRRLRMEFKEGYAAQVALRAAQMRLNQARRQGIVTDEEYTRQLARLGDVTRQSSQHMSRSGVAMQQVGYQVGDFIVQVQSGQNPMIAFGQQATQMVGALYMLPPATLAGSVGIMGLSVSVGLLIASLGIIIPLATAVGAAFMRARGKSKTFKESLSDLKDVISDLKGVQETLAMSVEDLKEKYGEAADAVREYALIEAQLKVSLARGEISKSITGLTDLTGAYSSAASGGHSLRVTLNKLERDFRTTREEGIALAAQFQALEDAKTFEDQKTAVDNLLVSIKTLGIDMQDLPSGIAQMLVNFIEANRESAEAIALIDALNSGIAQASDSAEDVADNAGKITWEITGAVNEAIKLRDVLNQVATATLSTTDKASVLRAQIAAARSGQSVAGAGVRAETAITLGRGGATADQIAKVATDAANAAIEVEGLENQLSKLLNPDKAEASTTGGGKSPQEELVEFLTKKKEEAALQSQLVGLFGEERAIQSELIKFKQNYGDVASEAQTKEYAATVNQIAADKERQKVLEENRKQQEQLADFIGNSMGDALMSIVDGTMSVKDAFKSMATDIIKELYRVLVVQQIVNAAKTAFGFADGGAFSGGSQVQAYADGGVVGGPTYFPMSGGKTGLMGEAGPEAIMPLKRGANGKLGVQMEGGGGGNTTVVQNFNFSANGDDSVKKIIAQAAPQIANMTKKSIMDDRRRGGQMKATFG